MFRNVRIVARAYDILILSFRRSQDLLSNGPSDRILAVFTSLSFSPSLILFMYNRVALLRILVHASAVLIATRTM